MILCYLYEYQARNGYCCDIHFIPFLVAWGLPREIEWKEKKYKHVKYYTYSYILWIIRLIYNQSSNHVNIDAEYWHWSMTTDAYINE